MSDYGSTPPPPPPQPAYGGGGVQGAPPPNYLAWAIVSIFLCWPVAIPSIVFSTQVNSKWAMGDVAGSQDASEKAKKFALWATILGAIGYVIAIAINVVAAMSVKSVS
jgi:Interferon-induced transmembrane protein